jgi:hypothetical protein
MKLKNCLTLILTTATFLSIPLLAANLNAATTSNKRVENSKLKLGTPTRDGFVHSTQLAQNNDEVETPDPNQEVGIPDPNPSPTETPSPNPLLPPGTPDRQIDQYQTTSPEQNTSEPPTVVNNELVYPNGVMVSIDKGTGLSSEDISSWRTGRASLSTLSTSRATVIECDPGYTCLYDAANFGGRRLQWRDRGQGIDLSQYGFNDKVSSWRNRNNVDARWYYAAGFQGQSRCINANTSNAYVGNQDNDQASSLRIYTRSTICN